MANLRLIKGGLYEAGRSLAGPPRTGPVLAVLEERHPCAGGQSDVPRLARPTKRAVRRLSTVGRPPSPA